MEVPQPSTNFHSTRPNSLTSLPLEIQIRIYENYYPPWSLIIHDYNLSKVGNPCSPGSARWQHKLEAYHCVHTSRCSPGACPDYDAETLFARPVGPIYLPSTNLILVCRSIYTIAHRVFTTSYRETLELSLASPYLGQPAIFIPLRSLLRQLLDRTNRLNLEVSKIHPFYSRNNIPGLHIASFLPNLDTICLQDAFKCTNTQSLLDKCDVQNWTAHANVDSPSEPLRELIQEAARKRMDLTMCWLLLGSAFGIREHEEEDRDWKLIYAFRCQIEGLGENIYASIPAPDIDIDINILMSILSRLMNTEIH